MMELPNRLNELWDWFSAVWAWDYNDPRQLSELIRKSEGRIPNEFVPVIADIVSGVRKPNKKAGAKLMIPASSLGAVSGYLLIMRDLSGALRTRADYGTEKRGAAAVAEYKGMKTIDVIRRLERKMGEAKEKGANAFGITEETIERLLREANRRIKKWPEV